MQRSAAILLLATPKIALANIVWPALYLSSAFYTWWVIAIGVLVEYIAIQRLFKLSLLRTALVDLTANSISALLGLALIPLSGIAYEIFPGSLINWAFNWGTFNPISWASAIPLAASVNLLVEGLSMKLLFGLTLTKRARSILFATNLITVGLAVYPLSRAWGNGA